MRAVDLGGADDEPHEQRSADVRMMRFRTASMKGLCDSIVMISGQILASGQRRFRGLWR